ncbi:MAG: alpha/beta hydrolase [Saprospiraceae bacterium]
MKIIFISIFSITLLANSIWAQPCQSSRYKKRLFSEKTIYEDITYSSAIPYAKSGQSTLKDYQFDFYEPMNDDVEKRPLVLMFCGGDFQKGDKKNSSIRSWCDSLASYGFACAAVNYRLGYNPNSISSIERAIYRSVQDVRSAVRYFKEFQQTFNIDTSQIYLGGDEAGAVAILHTAFLTAEKQRAKSTYGIPTEKENLGCLDCSGNQFRHNTNIAGLINMRGKITSVDLAQARQRIPVINIDDKLPVTSLEKDPLEKLKMKSTTSFHNELNRLGHPTTKEDISIFNASTTTFATSASQQIWAAAWQQIRAFLYETMTFSTQKPRGPLVACVGKPTLYEASGIDGEQFCWQIIGGKILEQDKNTVKVTWDYEVEEGIIRVSKTNLSGVAGIPSPPLHVKLHEVAEADFVVQEIEDNVIELKDVSSYGSFFTVDFGDGSNPQSGKPGDKIVHTYDLKDKYIITQTLESNCGTSVNTRPIRIKEITSDSWVVLKKAVDIEKESYQRGSDVTLSLNEIHYPKVRIKVIANETETKVFDEQIVLSKRPSIVLKGTNLVKGKYTVEIIADENTVRKYFEVE